MRPTPFLIHSTLLLLTVLLVIYYMFGGREKPTIPLLPSWLVDLGQFYIPYRNGTAPSVSMTPSIKKSLERGHGLHD